MSFYLYFQQITLKNKDTYDNWVKNPTPVFFQIWVWDLQNPIDVKEKGAKPSLTQRGPYSYRWNILITLVWKESI